MHSLPPEFSHYFEVGAPSEELQLRKWEEYLGNGRDTQAGLVDLVERYPLHLNEISKVIRIAQTNALLKGDETLTLEHVLEALKRFKGQAKIPVLFGRAGD